jgi:hypothetical protein
MGKERFIDSIDIHTMLLFILSRLARCEFEEDVAKACVGSL